MSSEPVSKIKMLSTLDILLNKEEDIGVVTGIDGYINLLNV